ncbi:MAG: dihydroneopterin aldolase [Kiritimatiellae bacterium]|nr:dihydroneopterin aldolase [Kiritimatiellia bacterium]
MDNLEGCDRIGIRDLQLTTVIGVRAEEQRERQNVCLNIALFTDTRAAAVSDDLADTVDYHALKLAIKERVEGTAYRLLERLAEEVATLCLRDRKVAGVQVRVGKPGALRLARTVEVEITRMRATTI